MKKKWSLVAGLVLVLVIAVLAACSSENSTPAEIGEINISSQQEGIWVSGQGKVSVDPDIATLRLGIEAQETSVAVAQTQAAEGMDSVMTALTRNGVAEKDIQTQQFSIRRVTKWDRTKEEEVVVGYRVTNMVTAKIRDIDEVGTIIDAVAQAGGDLTRVDSISFSVDDPSPYYQEAREEAMAEAKAKAEQIARLAGVTLGQPTYITEGMQAAPIYQRGAMFEEAMAARAPTPISPGELEISLSLQVVYAIR